MPPPDSEDSDADEVSPASPSPIEDLIARFLQRSPAAWDREIESFCAEHPEHAEEIRRRLASLERLGLVAREDQAKIGRDDGAQRIAHYRILSELGRGGQGVVYLAEDERLGRKVALKVLTGMGVLSEEALRRFRREAEVAARLDHPGICTVFDSGAFEGTPYIVFRLVEGESLAARIRSAQGSGTTASTCIDLDGPESTAAPPEAEGEAKTPATRAEVMAVVALVEKAARALHAAHEAGVIHRDIKPGNIMVTEVGEPVLLDFGLARDIEGDLPTLTRSGELFGTPAYMSPEQLTRQSIRLDARTDVYSLGVVLYECLTLRRPFEAPTREGLYQAILSKDAPDPRRINRSLPSDLRVILECALEKDRDRRYQTALALAEDLRRVQAREPIHARSPGLIARGRRWVQRHPVASTALAALVLLVAITGFMLLEMSLQNIELQAALEREEEALRQSQLVAWSAEVMPHDPELALSLAIKAGGLRMDTRARSALYRALGRYQPTRVLHAERSEGAKSVVLDDSGRWAAVYTDRDVLFYDVEEMRFAGSTHVIRHYKHRTRFSSQGRFFAENLWDPRANLQLSRVIDPTSGRQILRPEELCRTLAVLEFSRDEQYLLTADAAELDPESFDEQSSVARVWKLPEGKEVDRLVAPTGAFVGGGFVGTKGDGIPEAILATSGGELLRWRPGSDEEVGRLEAPELKKLVSVHRGLSVLITGGVRREKEGRSVSAELGRVAIMAEPDYALILVGGEVVMRDLQGSHNWRIPVGNGARSLLLSGRSRVLCMPFGRSVGGWNTIWPGRVMSVPLPVRVGPQQTKWEDRVRGLGQEWEKPLAAVALEDREQICIIESEGSLRIYDWNDGRLLRECHFGTPLKEGAIATEAGMGAVVTEDGHVRLWNLNAFGALPGVESVGNCRLHSGGLVSFSRGRADEEKDVVVLYEPPSHRPLCRIPIEQGCTLRVAASRNGKRVAWLANDELVVADAGTGAIRSRSKVLPRWRRPVAFDSTADRVAAVAEDDRVSVREATTGREILGLPQDGRVYDLVFGLDDRRLAVSATKEKTKEGVHVISASTPDFRLYRLPEGDLVAEGKGFVRAVSRDGRRALVVPDHFERSTRGAAIEASIVDLLDGSLVTHVTSDLPRTPVVALDPAGARGAIATEDGAIFLFGAGGVRQLAGHPRGITSLAFSPDGEMLASTGNDGLARLWRIESGSELAAVEAKGEEVSTSFNRTGEWWLLANDQQLRCLPVDPLSFARGLKLRALSPAERERYHLGE